MTTRDHRKSAVSGVINWILRYACFTGPRLSHFDESLQRGLFNLRKHAPVKSSKNPTACSLSMRRSNAGWLASGPKRFRECQDTFHCFYHSVPLYLVYCQNFALLQLADRPATTQPRVAHKQAVHTSPTVCTANGQQCSPHDCRFIVQLPVCISKPLIDMAGW